MKLVMNMIETRAAMARASAVHAASPEAARSLAAREACERADRELDCANAKLDDIGAKLPGLSEEDDVREMVRALYPELDAALVGFESRVESAWGRLKWAARAEAESHTWKELCAAIKRAESARDEVRVRMGDADVRRAVVAAGITIIPRKTSLGISYGLS